MEQSPKKERSSFSGHIGFVLAAAGSAVGLGNLWRFPYLAAKFGGGIFLLVYILLAVTFGFSLMIAEIAIGRRTRQSAVNAYGVLSRKWNFLGGLTSLVPIIILPYYCVIGGWVMKYLFTYLSGGAAAAAGKDYFTGYVSQTAQPLFWLFLFIGLTALVVLFGVEGGVERVSKFLMPVLVLLSIAVSVYVCTRPGAIEGIKYYLIPDFSRFSPLTVLAALGQLFYSMSLAMGIMITYGSYMKRDVSIEKSVHQIELFDTGVALIAGLMIVPAVFVFSGGDEDALGKGPGLMFDTLPKVFASFPLGAVVGAVFFLLVLFAALTSSISLMETVLSILHDKLHWDRKVVLAVVAVGTLLIGAPSSLGFGAWSGFTILGFSILDFFDFISNSVLMPLVALLTCLFIGHVVKVKVVIDEVVQSSRFHWKKLFVVMVRYLAPVCILLILISSVIDAFVHVF